jgi:hypothetical protein
VQIKIPGTNPVSLTRIAFSYAKFLMVAAVLVADGAKLFRAYPGECEDCHRGISIM